MASAPQPLPRRPPRASEALRRFELQGVQDVGVTVGDGSYATVKELSFHGLKCVGKKIHALLYEIANRQEKTELVRRFAEECKLLGRLHHPCIVQFLGVYFEQDSQLPVMVMEYLHTTLANCLDRYGVLPDEITYGVLRDTALGLRYLHEQSPAVVHRDLSANNILLTADMNAKISDLGVAKILNLTPAQITQRISTKVPGTPCYMPPEALVSKPSYTSKIDNYSYGVLMIHILCGRWPFPGDAFRIDPHNPISFLPVNEFDRRMEYLQKIGLDHPLMGLIRQCLSNAPPLRPKASDILREIEAMISQLPHSFENKVEMIRQHWPQSGTTGPRNEGEDETDSNNRDTESQKWQIEAQKREIESQKLHIEAQMGEIESQKGEIEAQKRQIEAQRVEIESKSREIEKQTREIEKQMRQVTRLRCEVESLRMQLEQVESIQQELPTHQVSADTKITWRRCGDLPMETHQHSAVLVRGKVYVGGGYTEYVPTIPTEYLVCRYDPRQNSWDVLTHCPVRQFALAEFHGNAITVGGVSPGGIHTGKVHRYKDDTKEWEEYLKPMPTARAGLVVLTTQSAIIACGGGVGPEENFATVEVYTSGTDQWHTSDPLPIQYADMSSVVIGDTCYLLGGHDMADDPTTIVLSAQISSLIEKADAHVQRLGNDFKRSVWKTLPDTPLIYCRAASLGGHLVAIGGRDDDRYSPAVHMFLPESNSWVRMPSGDLPVAVVLPCVFNLSKYKLLVCGGNNRFGKLLTDVYATSIAD